MAQTMAMRNGCSSSLKASSSSMRCLLRYCGLFLIVSGRSMPSLMRLRWGMMSRSHLSNFFDFALFFADYDCGEGFAHPVDFPLQVCFLLFVRCPRSLLFQFPDVFMPVKFNQFVHSHAGYFVDADQHGFAGFPCPCVVFREVPAPVGRAVCPR